MSKKAPRIKYRKALKALEKLGWKCVRSSGSHGIFKHPNHDHPITLLLGKPSEVMTATVHKGLRGQMGNEKYQQFIAEAE